MRVLEHAVGITIYTPYIRICKGWKVKCWGIILYREDMIFSIFIYTQLKLDKTSLHTERRCKY